MIENFEIAPAIRADGKARSILFLDDEKSYVDLMAQLMEEHFTCPILGHNRPMNALAALTEQNVGIIITDFYMPGMNGLEFIRQANMIAPKAVIFLITGHALELTESELLRLPGLKAVLHKPLSWRTLAEQIIPLWTGAKLLR